MARAFLSLLLALVLAAYGASFASATEDQSLCDDDFASVAQLDPTGDDFLADDEFAGDDADLGADDELADDEFTDEDDLGDEEEVDEDDSACDDQSADDESDDADEDEDGATRTRHGGRGTRGADRFVGDAGIDHFFGGAGDDFLDGAGGADQLNGGPDDDTLVTGKRSGRSHKRVTQTGDYANGGRGNDVFRARNGRRDRIFCGKGDDTVYAERGDTVSRNCETVKRG